MPLLVQLMPWFHPVASLGMGIWAKTLKSFGWKPTGFGDHIGIAVEKLNPLKHCQMGPFHFWPCRVKPGHADLRFHYKFNRAGPPPEMDYLCSRAKVHRPTSKQAVVRSCRPQPTGDDPHSPSETSVCFTTWLMSIQESREKVHFLSLCLNLCCFFSL